jgi:hypothetical protein
MLSGRRLLLLLVALFLLKAKLRVVGRIVSAKVDSRIPFHWK